MEYYKELSLVRPDVVQNAFKLYMQNGNMQNDIDSIMRGPKTGKLNQQMRKHLHLGTNMPDD